MPTKITVSYDNPTDPSAFEAGFADYDSASAAVMMAEAGVLVPTIFGLGTGGRRIAFLDVEAS